MRIRKIFALVPAMALTLSLAACGGGQSGAADEPGERALAYKRADFALPEEISSVVDVGYADGSAYVLGRGEAEQAAIFVIDMATGDYNKIPYSGPEGSNITDYFPDGEGGVWLLESVFNMSASSDIQFRDTEGAIAGAAAGSDSSEPGENGEAPGGDEEAADAQDNNGTGVFIGGGTGTKTYLRRLDKDGNVTAEHDLTAYMEGMFARSLVVDAEGRIYINGGTAVLILHDMGEPLFTIDASSYFNGMALAKDGTVLVSDMGREGISAIDGKTGKLGETVQTPARDFSLMSGAEYDAYIYDSDKLCGLDMASGEWTEIINWISSDLTPGDISQVLAMESGEFLLLGGAGGITMSSGSGFNAAVSSYGSVGGVSVSILKKSDVNDERTVLTYATLALDDNIRAAIVEFNQTNENYRIEVSDYSKYNTADDDSAGLTKLGTEIISGNIPDLIDLSGLPMEKYVELGLLEDLNGLLDADSEISRGDFIENILNAPAVSGGLYEIVPFYTVATAVGRSSDVGDGTGWTLDSYNAMAESLGEGVSTFAGITNTEFLRLMCGVMMDRFIDWETGKCYFDSNEFLELLALASEFPSVIDQSAEGYTQAEALLYGGKALLSTLSLSNEMQYQLYEALLGDNISFIGLPTEDGTGGSAVEPVTELSISAYSENKDGAWEFIKYLLSEKVQDSVMRSFPLRASSLAKKFESFMKPGEDGTLVAGMIAMMMDGGAVQITLEPLSEAAVEKLTRLINSLESVVRNDESLMSIILEEAAAYFSGSKSAGDVAALIQNRVSTYVSE